MADADRAAEPPPSFEIELQMSYVPSAYPARHISPSTPACRENLNAGFPGGGRVVLPGALFRALRREVEYGSMTQVNVVRRAPAL